MPQQKTRRAPGEGSITQRSDGRRQARLQVGGIRETVYGQTRSEAAEKPRRLQKTASQSGRLPANPRQTVGEYLADWLTQAEGRLPLTTLMGAQALF